MRIIKLVRRYSYKRVEYCTACSREINENEYACEFIQEDSDGYDNETYFCIECMHKLVPDIEKQYLISLIERGEK